MLASGVTDAYTIEGMCLIFLKVSRLLAGSRYQVRHLPITEHHAGQLNETGRLPGYIETDDPMISECIFEGGLFRSGA
jgi:hypothetical protein